MQKQKLKQDNNIEFKIFHKSKNRVRFLQPELSLNSDIKAYEDAILKLDNVTKARVNKTIKSVTVNFENIVLDYKIFNFTCTYAYY